MKEYFVTMQPAHKRTAVLSSQRKACVCESMGFFIDNIWCQNARPNNEYGPHSLRFSDATTTVLFFA